MTELNLDTRLSVPPQVMSRLVGEDTVLLNLETGLYFGIDGVGMRIWEVLSEGRTLAEAAELVIAEYEVDEVQALEDVVAFVGELVEKGLVKVRG